jgi:hypothetical protein
MRALRSLPVQYELADGPVLTAAPDAGEALRAQPSRSPLWNFLRGLRRAR